MSANGNGKRVCICTLGCKVNQYDSNAMSGALADSGFTICRWGDEADACIINTCTVTQTADSKARHMIRSAARKGIPVCVAGCLAERDAAGVAAMEGVRAVVPMRDRDRIVEVICNITGIPVPDTKPADLVANGPRTRTRGFLKIQEGCSHACSYCVIRFVRGRAKTRQVADILRDAQLLVDAGTRELVVTGINVSSYGVDNGASLPELLRALSAVSGVERLRLGSLDPWFLNGALVSELAQVDKLCPHFHVSLQSGCEATLRAMNRRYTPQQYENVLCALRSAFRDPALTTDVMTGFPGESEQDFEESLDFVSRMEFARLHVFPYSEREGTPAAGMSGAVPVHERRERAARMARLGSEMQRSYAERYVSTCQEVLFDRAEPGGASGYTDRYIRVYAPEAAVDTIQLVQIGPEADGIHAGSLVRTEQGSGLHSS